MAAKHMFNLIDEEKQLKKESGTYKIFISHSSEDRNAVTAFVELLESLGLTEKEVFCSSVPGYGVALGENIFDILRRELSSNLIYGIYFLSKNYYNSVACLNEMGAIWVLRNEYFSILLPGFMFEEIKGAVNPNQIAIDLNTNCRDRLNELKEKLEQLFSLPPIPWNRWERSRDKFIAEIAENFMMN